MGEDASDPATPARAPLADRLPDSVTLRELCTIAAIEMLRAARAGRSVDSAAIVLWREVDVEDVPVRKMLGRAHRVRLRIKVTADSLLFSSGRGLETKVIGPRAPRAHDNEPSNQGTEDDA